MDEKVRAKTEELIRQKLEEAQTALIEYDSIRSIEDRKERYRKYTEWEEKRFIGNIFVREEAEKALKERQGEQ